MLDRDDLTEVAVTAARSQATERLPADAEIIDEDVVVVDDSPAEPRVVRGGGYRAPRCCKISACFRRMAADDKWAAIGRGMKQMGKKQEPSISTSRPGPRRPQVVGVFAWCGLGIPLCGCFASRAGPWPLGIGLFVVSYHIVSGQYHTGRSGSAVGQRRLPGRGGTVV